MGLADGMAWEKEFGEVSWGDKLQEISSRNESICYASSSITKFFICESKDELNKIVESAENLLLEYRVKKHHDKLWHVTVMLAQ